MNEVGGDDDVKISFPKDEEYNQARKKRDYKAKGTAYAKALRQEGHTTFEELKKTNGA